MSPGSRDSSLETGNELIDRQHRDLMTLIDELTEAQADSQVSVLRALDRLMDFVLFHFQAEEDLMTQVGYPASLAREMTEQHVVLKSMARQRVVAYREAGTLDVASLQTFLEQLLKAHELTTDRLLADWIREKARPSVKDA